MEQAKVVAASWAISFLAAGIATYLAVGWEHLVLRYLGCSASSVDIKDVSGQAFYQACSDLSDAMANNRMVHSGQADLVQHLNNCAAKTSDAGWRIIRRKSAGDVTAAILDTRLISQ